HFQSLRPSDSAGGVVGPDQSSWVSVGSPAPVAVLLAESAGLRDLNVDRDASADAGWLTNCVLGTIAAVLAKLDPGARFRAVASVATDVDVLSAWSGRPHCLWWVPWVWWR
ncbi:hypothetical protein, partial [Catenuloplanes japonicus]|uniref:hypothetical protein n=1 Tax=Catenuloplanes japonicus TaxID=33876 RepID=UPI001E456923